SDPCESASSASSASGFLTLSLPAYQRTLLPCLPFRPIHLLVPAGFELSDDAVRLLAAQVFADHEGVPVVVDPEDGPGSRGVGEERFGLGVGHEGSFPRPCPG